MSEKDEDQFVQTELIVVADKKLREQITAELNTPDPTKEAATAALKEEV